MLRKLIAHSAASKAPILSRAVRGASARPDFCIAIMYQLIVSICRAAHYCDQACQRMDFKARHRDECANFKHLPTTTAFITNPGSSGQFPLHPIFAHSHNDGVGCWVTIAGRADCEYVNRTRTKTRFNIVRPQVAVFNRHS